MAEQNPDLLKQADELGIKTDKRWGDERLQKEIDDVLSGASAPEPFGGKGDHDGDGKPGGAAPALIAVNVLRDVWDGEGNRHRKGTIVEVPVEDAMDGVESGFYSRVR